MSINRDTWTRSHDLALVYVALAFGTDADLTDEELRAILGRIGYWRSYFPLEEVQVVIMEALTVFMEENAEAEVLRSIETLSSILSEEERRRALEDIIHIAGADGIILKSERSLINFLARTWNLKPLSQDLLEASNSVVEEAPDWSIMHDLSLVYVTMAHSTDNELSRPEIDAIISRLGDWHEELTEEEVREIIRSTLALYAKGPDEEVLRQSVTSIRELLPIVQRLAALDDLFYIAEADGKVNEHEQSMLTTLANAWGLAIRMNGRDPAA